MEVLSRNALVQVINKDILRICYQNIWYYGCCAYKYCMSVFRGLCGEEDDVEDSDDIGCSYSLALLNHIALNILHESRINYVGCSMQKLQ